MDYTKWGFWVNFGLTSITLIIAVASLLQAGAAKSSAHAQMASERAWLVIRSSMKDYVPSVTGNFDFRWRIENTGHTPAQIIETQCQYELVQTSELYSLPPIPAYPQPISLEGFLLAPGEVEEYKTGLRDDRGEWINNGVLDATDIRVVQMDMYSLRAYGYVKSTDVFGTARESRFCEYYVWPLPGRPSQATGFRPLIGVSPEYTKCT